MQPSVSRFRVLYSQPRFRALFYLSFLLGFAYSFVLPFMSMFAINEIGMSNMQFGLFMTLNAVGGVAIGTSLARYSDTHFSRRSMMLCGSVAGCIGYASYAGIHNFVLLALVGTFIIGLSTITFAQLFAHAREVLKTSGVNETDQAFYMNVFRMYFSLAWTVGPAVSAWMMVKFSVRGVFVCSAIIFLLFAVVVIRQVPRMPPPFAMQAAQTMRSRWWLLRRTDLFAHLGALTLIYATSSMCMSNLPLYILDTLHGTKANVGFAYSIAPVFELPLMLYFGWLATRRDAASVLRIGVFIGVAYYVALSLVSQPWQIYMCQLLSAAMVAVVFGLAITYFQSHMPHHPGIATNLYANANRIGSTAGYFLFGIVAGQYGYHAVFEVCGLFAAIAFLLMMVPVSVPADEAVA
ncbi:MAG: sugar efflux transporter [Steroidobacter sp.]